MDAVTEVYRKGDVRVFRLDREGTVRRVVEAAGRLVAERPGVEEVHLFGSLARGDAVPGSDADVLVVLEDGAPAEPDPADWFPSRDIGLGVDLLVWRRSALERAVGEGNPLLRRALAEGRVVAKRES